MVRRRIRTAVAIVLLALMLFPVYWMLNISLSPSGGALPDSFFPTHPSLDGYATAIRDQGANLVTSLIVAFGTVLVTLVIAAPAAYALAQFRFRWINWALLTILICQMIPGIVIANALYTLFESMGLLNSIPGLIIANTTNAIPFGVLIMRSFMLSIPSSIVEAARVDGAGLVRAFVSIVVPISRNSLITVGLFAFLFAWSDFLFALTMSTKGTITPVTLGIFTYLGAHVSNWNAVMASAMLASIPAIILLVIAQRYIAAGATGGSVK
ncbi:carbohydrate ABC transporter permease [Actinoplanes sp. NPDC049265]|uniref:carbohydrate ABC transporter permease n=1 Tax=Actinoplanes sp. NPDC049265 TaxID=3363902 RepID=UPI00371F5F62